MEAEIDKGLLEACGIACSISSDDVGGMRPDIMMSTGGAWLCVEEKDVEKVSKILGVE